MSHNKLVERLQSISLAPRYTVVQKWIAEAADCIKALDGALRPFAAVAKQIDSDMNQRHDGQKRVAVRLLHLRRARAALQEDQEKP